VNAKRREAEERRVAEDRFYFYFYFEFLWFVLMQIEGNWKGAEKWATGMNVKRNVGSAERMNDSE